MTAGIANMIMNEITSIDQTKSGMRLSDIPGARILNAVTTTSTATISPDISVKVIICAQVSTRFPGANRYPSHIKCATGFRSKTLMWPRH